MSALRAGPNVKLAKIFYKYADRAEKLQEVEPVKESAGNESMDHKNDVKTIVDEYEAYPPYNFTWFVEGKIAGMGWPQTVANVNYLADVGINHIITLSPERIPPIMDCKKQMKWTLLKIKEFSAPNLKQIVKFIEICKKAEMMGEVVIIQIDIIKLTTSYS